MPPNDGRPHYRRSNDVAALCDRFDFVETHMDIHDDIKDAGL